MTRCWMTAEPSRPSSPTSLRGLDDVLDDVEDLVDGERDAAPVLGVDDDRHGRAVLGRVRAEQVRQAQHRQDLVAVLHDLAVADALDAARPGTPPAG